MIDFKRYELTCTQATAITALKSGKFDFTDADGNASISDPDQTTAGAV